MKTFSRLFLLLFLLAACGPLTPAAPQPALTPGTYEYQDFAYAIAWSPDDSMVALTTLTGVYIYDAESYKQIFSFNQDGGWGVVFSSHYLAALDNKGISVFDLKDFSLLFHLDGSYGSLAFSPKDDMLAAASSDKTLLVNLPAGDINSTLDTGVGVFVSEIKFKNAERLIVANAYDGNVQEWDLKENKAIRKFNFPRAVSALRVSQDASLVLVDYGTTGFQLWDVATGKIHHNYGDIASATGWQRLSGNNKYVVVWGYAFDGQNSGMAVWDLDIHMHLEEFSTPFVNGDGWRCGSLNSDGSILAASNNEGYVYFYDPQTGKELGKFYLPYKYKVEKG